MKVVFQLMERCDGQVGDKWGLEDVTVDRKYESH